MTIKLEQELYIEKKEHLWILGSSEIISIKIGNQDVSTVIHMGIWQRIVKGWRNKKKQESAISRTKWDALLKTAD